jgi:hypothetical protein
MINFKKFELRLPDSPWQLLNSASQGVADSPTRWVFFKTFKSRLSDSPSQGVIFLLRISPWIQSLNRNGLKGCVRDLWGTNFCKNPRKSASFPCPFKVVSNNYYFQYIFTLTAGKTATAIAHQIKILEIQKQVKVLSWTQNYSFVSKNLNYISWPRPFNAIFPRKCSWFFVCNTACRF